MSATGLPTPTIPSFDDSGLRWVVLHDGTTGRSIVTEQAADFGTEASALDAVVWLTKCGCSGITMIDRAA